jgi:hypothetical protein
MEKKCVKCMNEKREGKAEGKRETVQCKNETKKE